MRKKTIKNLIIFIICIPIFLFIAFQVSSRMEGQLPQNAIENKSQNGYSVFYETMKKLTPSVERTLKPLSEQDADTIQLISAGGNFNINSAEVKDWIQRGGTLVYLQSADPETIDYGASYEKNGLEIYDYGHGKVISCSGNDIENAAMIKDTHIGYELYAEIVSQQGRKIYFNEANLFSETNKSIWDYVPVQMRFVIYQFGLIVIAILFYKGKRFGNPIPLYEEVERDENEYLHCAASLYRQANCWDIILENYYKSFISKLRWPEDNIIESWQNEGLPKLHEVKKIYEFMHKDKPRIRKKEILQIVNTIEQLNDILEKRREEYWKTLWKK